MKSQQLRAGASAATLAVLLLTAIASTGQEQSGQTLSNHSLTTKVSPAQASPVAAQIAPANSNATTTQPIKPIRQPSAGDRRRAAKIFLRSSKLFTEERFEEAMRGYEKAANLDFTNANYALAAGVARNHAVTAEIQAAAKDRLRGESAAARAALAHALVLDPQNFQVAEHLNDLGNDQLLGLPTPLYEKGAASLGVGVTLAPQTDLHSFHLRTGQRQIIQQVFRAYGIETSLDDSVRGTPVRFDIDDASFEQATHSLGLVTTSFYVPLDAHRVLVARDTPDNRKQFSRQDMETIYLSGLTATEMEDVSSLAKNVFEMQTAELNSTTGTITIRAPDKTLTAFNATLRDLLAGQNQVLLEMRLIQVAHSNEHNTGTQLPQSVSAFNVYGEEESILSTNSTAVQEIIASGLASANDPLAILAILVAAGDVSSSLFSSGMATFGGGVTESAISPGTVTVNLSLNSSDSRVLDQVLLRLGDGEAGTVRLGQRYPIQTSSYSSLASSTSSIAGLTSSGTSSALSSLLSSLSSSSTIPMIEYHDLGLTLKTTPKVIRNDEVALTIDMKIDALEGTSINDVPVLDSRVYNGVVTIKEGTGVVVMSELKKSESRAISGTPGLSEIPGLSDLTNGKDKIKSSSSLLIIITAHVIRGTQAAGHTPMMRVERSTLPQ